MFQKRNELSKVSQIGGEVRSPISYTDAISTILCYHDIDISTYLGFLTREICLASFDKQKSRPTMANSLNPHSPLHILKQCRVKLEFQVLFQRWRREEGECWGVEKILFFSLFILSRSILVWVDQNVKKNNKLCNGNKEGHCHSFSLDDRQCHHKSVWNSIQELGGF